MREKLTNRDAPPRRLRFEARVRRIELRENGLRSKRRQVVADRIVETEPALLPEYHHRGGRDGFRLRGNSKNVIGPERLSGAEGARTVGFVVGDAAVAHEHDDGARNLTISDQLLDPRVDAREAR